MKKDPLLILARDRKDFEKYIFVNKLPRKDVIHVFTPRQLIGRQVRPSQIVKTEGYLDNVNQILEEDLLRRMI